MCPTLVIKLDMPIPAPSPKQPCLMRRVKEWLAEVEDQSGSSHAWNMIRLLFHKLDKIKKKTPEQEAIFALVAPCVKKHSNPSSEA